MFRKILIANRGEIALRIIRACKELGISTVAVYSKADTNALHTRLADEAICIGPADAMQSYRHIPNVISAADVTGADAVHPGYGFLAEDGHFVEMCESIGLTFIGPTAANLMTLGDKAKTRAAMKAKGIPVVPGSEGEIADESIAQETVDKIGYPIIVKACSGGGGRGLRVVYRPSELKKAFAAAQHEGMAINGREGVYIERYIAEPRHIEVQILVDHEGNTIFLGERECSIQRKYQKLIEETPSPAVTESVRKELGRVATRAVQAVGYLNAGTIEFLLDQDQKFYFMELNPRIQVEHPITEMVTGVDIVKEQIRIAAGLPLQYRQKDIEVRGHSFECRITAECPERFVPSPGQIRQWHQPGGLGVRVDSGVDDKSMVFPHYDSLIAKLIVHGNTREEAIAKMQCALDEFIVEGIKTTIPLHKRVFQDPDFRNGHLSTKFLERFISNTS
jgi:acetyl-CoA carboxylase biotin carboxylase subunit